MHTGINELLAKTVRTWIGDAAILRLRRLRARFESTEQTFTRIRQRNSWGSRESASGAGSTLEYTENIRREIPVLLGRLGVKRMLDAPCGDYNWFRFVERCAGVEYVGGDIVRDIVDRNNAAYADARTSFLQLDITRDPLPPADLWLCRDALFHLSNGLIHDALANFLRSDIEYLLTTSHTECGNNVDIPTGYYRELNLQREPFSLPDPILWIDDWIPGFPVRRLGLWNRGTVAAAYRPAAG